MAVEYTQFKNKTMKQLIISLVLLLIVSCNGQEKESNIIAFQKTSKTIKNNTMREKFDFEMYEKTNYGSNPFVLDNGHIVYMIDFSKNKSGFQYEELPNPSFEVIYKEFDKDGFITKKEHLIGQSLRIGTSEYYDEQGNKTTVNEDDKFGKIKPIDALKFLEEKKLINLKTGEGKKTKDGWLSFELDYKKIDGRNKFIIIIKEGEPNMSTDFGIGEPRSYLPIAYLMDGETGKVERAK